MALSRAAFADVEERHRIALEHLYADIAKGVRFALCEIHDSPAASDPDACRRPKASSLRRNIAFAVRR